MVAKKVSTWLLSLLVGLYLLTPLNAKAQSEIEIANELVEVILKNAVELIRENLKLSTNNWINSNNPSLDTEQSALIGNAVNETVDEAIRRYRQGVASVYVKHFNADELKQLLAFNTTPVGKKHLALNDRINQDLQEKMSSTLGSVRTSLFFDLKDDPRIRFSELNFQ